jgi:DNA-binding MarR family transcriptional regulator
MPESDDLYNRILSIERQVENIDAKLAISLASDPRILDAAIDLFTNRKATLLPLYFAVDGVRNVTDIAKYLNKDLGNVSRFLKELRERGYIDKIDEAEGGAIYKKNQFEKILRLSERLKSIK